MRRSARVALVAALMMSAAGVARADCASDIQRIQAQVGKVGDARVKRMAQFDVERARREAGEGDDDECQEAVEHADKLLASAAPAP